MSKFTLGICLGVMLLIVGLGCSGSSNPDYEGPTDEVSFETQEEGRAVIGLYKVIFDEGTMEFSVVPNREPTALLNPALALALSLGTALTLLLIDFLTGVIPTLNPAMIALLAPFLLRRSSPFLTFLSPSISILTTGIIR